MQAVLKDITVVSQSSKKVLIVNWSGVTVLLVK